MLLGCMTTVALRCTVLPVGSGILMLLPGAALQARPLRATYQAGRE